MPRLPHGGRQPPLTHEPRVGAGLAPTPFHRSSGEALNSPAVARRGRRTYLMLFPHDLHRDAVLAVLRALYGPLRLSLLGSDSTVALEVYADVRGIRYYFTVAGATDGVEHMLQTHLAGATVTPIDPTDDIMVTTSWSRAVEVGTSNAHVPLRIASCGSSHGWPAQLLYEPEEQRSPRAAMDHHGGSVAGRDPQPDVASTTHRRGGAPAEERRTGLPRGRPDGSSWAWCEGSPWSAPGALQQPAYARRECEEAAVRPVDNRSAAPSGQVEPADLPCHPQRG